MKKRGHKVLWTITAVLLLSLALLNFYAYFGGWGSGESADVDEFRKYAKGVEDIQVPYGTRIVALGEATHGNKEFQQLKLEVFRIMVEKYGIKAFALEADYGCCMKANEYIQGGEGSAEQAAADLGFQIYRTEEMAELLEWMHSYNQSSAEKLSLYGFDMQKIEFDYQYLLEMAEELEIDTQNLITPWDSEQSIETRRVALQEIRKNAMCQNSDEAVKATHLTDILLQYLDLEEAYHNDINSYASLRDSMMAENTLWIMRQEESRGNKMIFVSGHNGHIEQGGSHNGEAPVMGRILAERIGEEKYFAIGTDFFKTCSNMPKNQEERTTFSVHSHDPLAKAAKKAGYDICWLDFSKISKKSELLHYIDSYIYMGSLGENQMSMLNRVTMTLLPQTYRIWRCPAEMYDGMIIVTRGHETVIKCEP